MRNQLLPQKAATAIQSKLQTIRQNERSVADFGKEISELFSDLTISQANGNTDHYDILRPLNEKLAIKRFADGLPNSRLSTIIAARNFSTLKDAIQAAHEEEMTSNSSAQVTSMAQKPSRGFYRRPYRGQRGHQKYRGQWNNNNNKTPYRSHHQPQPSSYQKSNSRGRSSRGRYYRSSNYQRQVHTMTPSHDTSEQQHVSSGQPETESLNHFFVANYVYVSKSLNKVSIKLNNHDCNWLIDTGASISVVKNEIIQCLHILVHKGRLRINEVGGSVYSEGYAYLKLNVDGNIFKHKFYIFDKLPCKTDGILGQDFLKIIQSNFKF